jgi:hypothetical protein
LASGAVEVNEHGLGGEPNAVVPANNKKIAEAVRRIYRTLGPAVRDEIRILLCMFRSCIGVAVEDVHFCFTNSPL